MGMIKQCGACGKNHDDRGPFCQRCALPTVLPADSKPMKQGVLRWSLAPLWLFKPVVQVLMHGADKGYEPLSWMHSSPEEGMTKYPDAMIRHVEGWQREGVDPESNITHLGAIAFNALTTAFYERGKTK